MSLNGMPIESLEAIGILVLGSVVVLLSVGPISTRSTWASAIGAPFAVIAAWFGFQAPQPLGLATVCMCIIDPIALLLLPALEAEVASHVAEAAALLLLAAAGAIGLASAADVLQAVVGLETLALSAVI